ncbi:MAG: bifunctional folylpolyglutamate synthase/dihydrofolate synthase [Nodosilinea sp.]
MKRIDAKDPAATQVAVLLEGLGQFGVNLGLERMVRLLQAMGNPQQRVPIIHVAGTNGKGSVCAYLASVLTQAGYRVGRYTSPHLVTWAERITINEVPISAEILLQRLQQALSQLDPARPSPTQFEVITAAAWLHFAETAVDVAVMEVGLGGRLDATNVVEAPLVSIITSLSRDHWQVLGSTLGEIAGEKAGILKPGRPAVIGPLPPAAETVVKARLTDLSCPAVWPTPAVATDTGWACYGEGNETLTYPLPFPGEHQLSNSAVAIAALYRLREQGWDIPAAAIVHGMAQAKWPGRLQWVTWPDAAGQPQPLLIDGAHNPAAAEALRSYVDTWLRANKTTADRCPPVLWLMGMLSTKDHREIFAALLRPGDYLHLVPVPGHASAPPGDLAAIAQAVCPELVQCQPHASLTEGLGAIAAVPVPLKVLCGSLYLVGDFFAQTSRSIKS